jgi:hypothetical protein
MRSVSPTVPVLACIGFVACGGDVGSSPESAGVTVHDSAGVTIVENGTLDLTQSLLAAPEPTVQIGVLDGEEEYQFFQVAAIKRLSDGAIAVANGGSRELRIYEADGTHRATAGGAGRGPSEFRYPAALVILPGDTIQVQDFMDRVYFAPDGTFLRRESADQQAITRLWEAAGGRSEGGAWVADGSFFAPIYHWDQNPPKAGPLFRPAMTLVRVSDDLSVIDTLGDFGGIRQQYVDVGGERGASAFVPPFSTNTSWAIGGADGTIVAGDNASPQIDRFHPDGTHSVVRWTVEAEGVTDAEVEAWKDRQRTASWTQDRLPELERGWAGMDIPETKAFYGRVVAGSDGSLWTSPVDYLADPTVLMAFDSQGRFAGTVEIPGSFVVHDSGPGWVLGLLRGESDVEYIQMFVLRQ